MATKKRELVDPKRFSAIAIAGDPKSVLDTRLADGTLTICFRPGSLAMKLAQKFEAELRKRTGDS